MQMRIASIFLTTTTLEFAEKCLSLVKYIPIFNDTPKHSRYLEEPVDDTL